MTNGRSAGSGLVAMLFAAAIAVEAADGACARMLTLDQAIALAVAQSPAARAAAAEAAVARAAIGRIEAEGMVQVRLDSRIAWLSKVASMEVSPAIPAVEMGEHATWSASLAASYPLWTGGRVPAMVRQAEAAARAIEADVSRSLQVAAYGAERAFRLLAAAQEERTVAAQLLAAAESHRAVAEARFDAGAAARFDVIRAEVQVEDARQTLVQKESAIASAHAGLLRALGQSEGEFEAVPPPETRAPRPSLPELIAAALASRPEMEAARLRQEAASAGLAAAKADRMPVAMLSADYQIVEPDSLTQYDRLAVGASVSVPVLDGGRARARKGEAQQAALMAAAAGDGVRLQVEAEVRQAWARMESAEAQVAIARKRIEQAEELLRLAGVRYEGGVGTATEVADAQASLASSRFGLTKARMELGIAEAELRLAGGMPQGTGIPAGGGP